MFVSSICINHPHAGNNHILVIKDRGTNFTSKLFRYFYDKKDLVHGRDPNVAINQYLQTVPVRVISRSDYLAKLLVRLRYSFAEAREENEKARKKQKEQFDRRAKALEYKIGDRVLLDIRVLSSGDCNKFLSAVL